MLRPGGRLLITDYCKAGGAEYCCALTPGSWQLLLPAGTYEAAPDRWMWQRLCGVHPLCTLLPARRSRVPLLARGAAPPVCHALRPRVTPGQSSRSNSRRHRAPPRPALHCRRHPLGRLCQLHPGAGLQPGHAGGGWPCPALLCCAVLCSAVWPPPCFAPPCSASLRCVAVRCLALDRGCTLAPLALCTAAVDLPAVGGCSTSRRSPLGAILAGRLHPLC